MDLVGCVESAFHQGWPEADGEVTTSVVLRAHVQDMVTGLSEVIGRLRRRLRCPVCTVCGQSVSPLSSDRQRVHFEESHEERCGGR